MKVIYVKTSIKGYMKLYKEFKESIESLNEHKVDYLVIGGYA
jgi:hypothetical protein